MTVGFGGGFFIAGIEGCWGVLASWEGGTRALADGSVEDSVISVMVVEAETSLFAGDGGCWGGCRW